MGRRRSSAASMAASMMVRALLEELLGELDDEDRVLGGETDEHDEADLHVDVVDQGRAMATRRERAEDGHGNGEQDDERQREALVLGREREIDDEQAEAEDDDGLAGGLDFFEREAGPGEGHALASCSCRRAAAWRRGPGRS